MGLSKLLKKLDIGLGSNDSDSSSAHLPAAEEAVLENITQKQIYQARYNFGVNFGGVFVREKWIYHSTFPEGTENELEAVTKKALENRDEARDQLEQHWTNYALDEDWDWLKSKGVNSVRVPLGYWNIDGGNYTEGTKFEEFKDIYANSWNIFKSHYIEPAAARGITILVDIHGLPGGANKDAHSGEQGSGGAGFWESESYQELVIKALVFVARDLKQYENISGIQIVNESEASGDGSLQKEYYTAALEAIRQEDKQVPVIISDGWLPNQWVEWVQQAQGPGESAGLVLDTHCYRCFSDDDKSKTAEQISDDLHGDLLTNLNDNGKGVDIMVGEWSSVLDGQTWSNCGIDPSDGDHPQRKELASKFCCTQARLFEHRAGASYFWTYKFEAGSGGEWDFRQQVGHAFEAPKVSVPEESLFNEIRDRETESHSDYWNNQNPDENYEHDRFTEGFSTAWLDSVTFANTGSLVGRKEAVRIARLQQHLRNKGELPFVWEWEQGYAKGLEEFYKAVQG